MWWQAWPCQCETRVEHLGHGFDVASMFRCVASIFSFIATRQSETSGWYFRLHLVHIFVLQNGHFIFLGISLVLSRFMSNSGRKPRESLQILLMQ